jgi:hypothetical protein
MKDRYKHTEAQLKRFDNHVCRISNISTLILKLNIY